MCNRRPTPTYYLCIILYNTLLQQQITHNTFKYIFIKIYQTLNQLQLALLEIIQYSLLYFSTAVRCYSEEVEFWRKCITRFKKTPEWAFSLGYNHIHYLVWKCLLWVTCLGYVFCFWNRLETLKMRLRKKYKLIPIISFS